MKSISLLLLSVLFSFITLHSQTKEEVHYFTQNYTGFPLQFTDFAIDDSSNLYLSHNWYDYINPGGVTKFDGLHWKLIKKGDNDFPFAQVQKIEYSPSDNSFYIYGMYYTDDVENQVWGISKYDRQTNSWIIYGDSLQMSPSLTDMAVDNNGVLYVACYSGFYKITQNDCIKYSVAGLPDFHAECLALDGNSNTIYVARNSTGKDEQCGIYRFDGNTLNSVVDPLDSMQYIWDLTVDNNGNIWVLGNNNPNNIAGCYLAKISADSTKYYKFSNDLNIFAAFYLDGNYLWLTSYNNLIKFNTLDNTYETFDISVPFEPKDPIAADRIIATENYLYLNLKFRNVLLKINKNNLEVSYYSIYNTGIPSGGGYPEITSLKIDREGNYLLNSYYSGVGKYNGDYWKTYSAFDICGNLQMTSYDATTTLDGHIVSVGDSIRMWDSTTGWHSYHPPSDLLYSFDVSSVEADSNNLIWISDFYNGVLLFDYIHSSYTLYTPQIIGNSNPTKLFVDKDNNLWIGLADTAVTVFNDTNFQTFDHSNGIDGSYVTGFAQAPDGTIWVSFYFDGIAKFANGVWTSYTQTNSNLPSDNITAIAVDTTGKVWIGCANEDGDYPLTVFYSSDGTNWESKILHSEIYDGVSDIDVDKDNNILISTNYYGVFVYNENLPIVGISNENKGNVSKFILSQNYPNPFNPTTTITYSIPNVKTLHSNSLSVKLDVYNILGRKVATLVNKKQSPGNYSVKFNARNLNSGVYFYRLRAGNFVSTKKMILLK